MDREAFKLRMKSLKSYRELNPGKGYWDWRNNLPDNLKNTDDYEYDMRGAYESGALPMWNENDQSYHLPSRDPKTGKILKKPGHATYWEGIATDIKEGYYPYSVGDDTYTRNPLKELAFGNYRVDALAGGGPVKPMGVGTMFAKLADNVIRLVKNPKEPIERIMSQSGIGNRTISEIKDAIRDLFNNAPMGDYSGSYGENIDPNRNLIKQYLYLNQKGFIPLNEEDSKKGYDYTNYINKNNYGDVPLFYGNFYNVDTLYIPREYEPILKEVADSNITLGFELDKVIDSELLDYILTKPKDNVGGHLAKIGRQLDNLEFLFSDIWDFNPKGYSDKWHWGSTKKLTDIQSKLLNGVGKPFILKQNIPIKFEDRPILFKNDQEYMDWYNGKTQLNKQDSTLYYKLLEGQGLLRQSTGKLKEKLYKLDAGSYAEGGVADGEVPIGPPTYELMQAKDKAIAKEVMRPRFMVQEGNKAKVNPEFANFVYDFNFDQLNHENPAERKYTLTNYWRRADDRRKLEINKVPSVPYVPENEVMLTTGRFNTGRISTNVLDSLYSSSLRTGYPLEDYLGLVGRESGLGYARNHRQKGYISPTELTSNWNQVQTIFVNNNMTNKVANIIDKYNKLQPISSDEIEYVKKYISLELKEYDSTRPIEENVFDNAIKYFEKGLYNPGEEGYIQRVRTEGRMLMNDPAIKKWRNTKVNSYAEGGTADDLNGYYSNHTGAPTMYVPVTKDYEANPGGFGEITNVHTPEVVITPLNSISLEAAVDRGRRNAAPYVGAIMGGAAAGAMSSAGLLSPVVSPIDIASVAINPSDPLNWLPFGLHFGNRTYKAGRLILDPKKRAAHAYVNISPAGYDNVGKRAKSWIIDMLKGEDADILHPKWSLDELGEGLLDYLPESVKNRDVIAGYTRDDAWRIYNGLEPKYGMYIKNGDGTYSYNMQKINEMSEGTFKPAIKFLDTPIDYVTGSGGGLTKFENNDIVTQGMKTYGIQTIEDIWDLNPFRRIDDKIINRYPILGKPFLTYNIMRHNIADALSSVSLRLKYDSKTIKAIYPYASDYEELIPDIDTFAKSGLRYDVGKSIENLSRKIKPKKFWYEYKPILKLEKFGNEFEVGTVSGGKPFKMHTEIPYTRSIIPNKVKSIEEIQPVMTMDSEYGFIPNEGSILPPELILYKSNRDLIKKFNTNINFDDITKLNNFVASEKISKNITRIRK